MAFISSHIIFHPEFRDDPIFPARHKARFPPDYPGPDLFYNNSTQAGVLGCVDQCKICKSSTGPCWDNGNISSILTDEANASMTEEELVIDLLLLALDLSSACGSIEFRGAEALDAQGKIAHMQSFQLAEKQWQVEAEKLFHTSLARMQLNLYDVVREIAANFDEYHNILPEKFRGLCQLVEIQTIGWRNINFLGFMGTVLAAVLFWGISRKMKTSSGEKRLFIVLMWVNGLKPVVMRSLVE
jgi:hypothetical protein